MAGSDCRCDWCKLNAAGKEITRQRDRLRAVVHILNEVVPLDGPKNAEDVARLAVDELTRLRAELERVREALAPFAKAFREVPGSAWAHATAHIDDFRRAAQVMKEIEG